MEQGNLKRGDFMKEIIAYTDEICTKARSAADLAKSEVFPDLKVTCPMCGAPSLKQTEATYECREPECKFKAKKHIAGRLLTEEEAIQLFTTKHVGPLTGFRSKFNKPFDAALEMDAKFKINFVFEGDDRDGPPELTEEQFIGEAKTEEGKSYKVYATEKAYHVPEIVTKKDPHGIRIGKSILQCEIPQDQILKLISTGKTDVLKGFVSNRTKRKFDAHLTFDAKDGKIGFDFPPRPVKKVAAKKAAKAKEA